MGSTVVKRDAKSSKLVMRMGYNLSLGGIQKEYLFLTKIVKGVRGWTSGWRFPVKLC